MGRGRFGKCLLLLGLLSIAIIAVGAYPDEPLPDLTIDGVSFTPQGPVVRGDPLSAAVVIVRAGQPVDGPVRVEISWRRLDAEGACGSVIETLASDGETVEVKIDTSLLTPGTYELVARVDPEDLIAESDETNNRAVFYFDVLPPRPELHPVSLNVDPASPLEWGETATVTAGVENTGRLSAGAFHVEFLLFPIYCHDPDTGEAWTISALASGDGEMATWVFSAVDAPPADLTELTAEIPPGAWIPFSSVRIPGLERDQQIGVSNPFWTGQPLRDLLAASGEETISGSIMTPLSDDELELLEGCVTTYAIEILVGEPAGMLEEDPMNNRLRSALTVQPSTLELPELVPVQITFDRDLPLNWDDDMDAEVVVTNRGGSGVLSGFDVSYYYRRSGESEWIFLDKERISQLGIEEDSNTESVKATIDADPSRLSLRPGSYELRVVVDEADVIREQNEENNELVVGFSVKGSEIHPISLDLPSAPVHQGDTVSVVALVENTGELSLHDFTVGFYVDDIRFDTFYYRSPESEDGLEEDDRTRVEGLLDTSDLPPEEYTLRVVIDPDDRIPELDEGNNTISAPLTILPPLKRQAELQLTGVDLSPASPIGEGSRLVVSATVRNAGDIDADRFQIRFEVLPVEGGSAVKPQPGDRFYITQDVPGLARSASRVIQVTFTTEDWPKGSYELRVRVDPPSTDELGDRGEVDEIDELNDEMIVSFAIGPPPAGEEGVGPTDAPNLAFADLAVSPSTSVDVGTPIKVSGSVINRGRRPAGPFRITIKWLGPGGGGYTVTTQDVSGLGVGESVAITPVTIQTSFPMGTYRLVATVDARAAVEEQNEADNERTIEVTVGGGAGILPDLVPTSIRFVPPSGAQLGERVIAYVTVRNQGPLALGPFSIAFTTLAGTDYIIRDGLGPLGEVEIPYTFLPTVAGEYEVSVVVDPDDALAESNEKNNAITGSVEVAPPARIEAVGVVHDDSPVRLLAVDRPSGTVYAAWSNGKVWAISRNGEVRLLFDAGEGITALAIDSGAKSVVYVGTSGGKVDKVDAATGELIVGSAPFVSPVRVLVLAGGGGIYVGTEERLLRLASDLQVIAAVDVSGGIVDLAYDEPRETVYAVSPDGLYAFDADLAALSDVSGFYGKLSALSLGNSGLFVGTDAGVLYVYSYCMSHAGSPPMMLAGWRFPKTGTLEGGITSLVAAGGTGTTYVATSGGKVYAVSLTGESIWTYPAIEGETVSPIHAIPVVEGRSGRLFFGDDSGIPYILESNGSPAFSVDASATGGAAIRSDLVVDERREETESGRVLVRTYYYGAEDGWVYRIDSLK